MDYFEINGGNRLRGSVTIGGAKNAALPVMAACLLCEGETVLRNVPDLQDVRQMLVLLGVLGVKSERDSSGALHLRVEDEMNAHRRPLRAGQQDASEHLRAGAAAG